MAVGLNSNTLSTNMALRVRDLESKEAYLHERKLTARKLRLQKEKRSASSGSILRRAEGNAINLWDLLHAPDSQPRQRGRYNSTPNSQLEVPEWNLHDHDKQYKQR